MNGIRCPQCSLVNPTSALRCEQCAYSFAEIPGTAYVSVPATDYEQRPGYRPALYDNLGYQIGPDNETGRKVHLWFRIYCALFVLLSFCLVGLGLYMASMPADLIRNKDQDEVMLGAVIYIVAGLAFAAVYLFLILMPRRQWAWIVGIVAISFGIISCCFLPSIIMLIFWAKRETRAYFNP